MISGRMRIWKKLAQQNTAVPETPVTSVPLGSPQTVNIQTIPGFDPSLFSAKPEVVIDFSNLLNLLNRQLFEISKGKVLVSDVWLKPGIDISRYYGAIKNLYSLTKYVVSSLIVKGNPYDIHGIKKILDIVSNMLNSMTFPEAQAISFKSEISTQMQALLNKIGN